ncbi:MAG: MGMT family protein [Microterricola sp.]
MAVPDRGFAEAVLAVVDDIPAGHVMTYGDVAAMLGSRGARAVGQVMAYYGSNSPWWRVLRAGGHPPRGLASRALPYYDAEGTPLITTTSEDGYRVDYAAARWRP